jgi:uncharacterized glyoxalase superfamily protein PhnB
MSEADTRPAASPTLAYRDPIAAIAWLEAAFGCESSALVTDKAGRVAHAVVTWRDFPIGVMHEWESEVLLGPARMRSPASLEGRASAFLRLMVDDIDAHCERARAAGARITQEPADQFYGERTYRALDPEGHVWNFTQTIRQVSTEDIERSGLKVHR